MDHWITFFCNPTTLIVTHGPNGNKIIFTNLFLNFLSKKISGSLMIKANDRDCATCTTVTIEFKNFNSWKSNCLEMSHVAHYLEGLSAVAARAPTMSFGRLTHRSLHVQAACLAQKKKKRFTWLMHG